MYKKLNIDICNSQTNDVYPQVEHMGPDYAWEQNNSITNIISNHPLGFAPDMQSFYLNEKTSLTDVISQSYIYTAGLLASERFQAAISGYTVQKYDIYPAEVIYQNKAINYVWLHFVVDIEQYINYRKSRFVVTFSNGREDSIEIDTTATLRKLEKEVIYSGSGYLEMKEVTFHSGVPFYDFFFFRLQGNRYYVSERLAIELERRKLTGFIVEPFGGEVKFE